MDIADTIRLLENQHAELDRQIEVLTKSGMYGDLHMQTLKKQKLEIRDRLSALRKFEYDENQRTGYGDE